MVDVLEYTMSLEKRRDASKEKVAKGVPLTHKCAVLVMTTLLTIGELVMAQMYHSITLVVLVHQNIYNAIILLAGCIATKISTDKSLKATFGWKRLEVVGTISSLVFLFSLLFATFIEAIQTIVHSDHLDVMHHPDWILVILSVHLAVWFVAFFLIGGHTHFQNTVVRYGNEEGVTSFQHFIHQVHLKDIVRDLQGLLFNLVTCLLIMFNIVREEYTVLIDPVISMMYIVSLIWSSSTLFKHSSYILLQTIPGNVEVSVLQKVLMAKFPEIHGVYEFHIWTLTAGVLVLTAHIKYNNKQAYLELSGAVDQFFKEHSITIVTIQPEFLEDDSSESSDPMTMCLSQGEEDEKSCCHTDKHQLTMRE